MHHQDSAEANGTITVVAAENKNGKVSAVNPDLCIGCGVCVYKCPTNSLVLERREVIEHPPKNEREHVTLLMADFAAGRAQQRQGQDKQ